METEKQRQNKKLHQTKYVAYVASSIDGRIAKDSNSGTDWTSAEDWIFFQNSLSKMDAVIVGHNTYKVAMDRLKKRNTIVLTSKVSKLRMEGKVVFINPEKDNLKRFIKISGYRTVAVIGGPQVYYFCLKNKMLDELFVTVEPYIFGNGVPMFSGQSFSKHRMILQSVKKLNKPGTLLLKYKNGSR